MTVYGQRHWISRTKSQMVTVIHRKVRHNNGYFHSSNLDHVLFRLLSKGGPDPNLRHQKTEKMKYQTEKATKRSFVLRV